MIADLHLHGKYSRGCSKELTIDNLEKYAKIKGIDLLGTGDFSQPAWNAHLKEKLIADGNGFFRTKSGFPFILQNEYSMIYSQDGKGRRIHLVILAPDFEIVDQINEEMLKHGRLDYDGRPIFGMSCPDFVERMMSISKDIEIFPAHIWTPWFSLLGSKSGFDSVEECFQDQSNHIHAIETGLSSDPPMNWRLSKLDKYQILSSSDSHSYWPWRIGREATIFDIKPSYKSLIKAIRTGDGIAETIEVDPNYGKYHVDGHRKCGVVMDPEQSLEHNNICPVCKKPLTVGVLQRVLELADREEGYEPKDRPGFRTLIPLHEIISAVMNRGVATKGVWAQYNELLKLGKNENDILLNTSYESLLKVSGKQLADAIIMNREGRVYVEPGYDGVYGKPHFDGKIPETPEIKKSKVAQKGIDEFF